MAKKNLLMALAVLVFASATALAQVERDAARPGLMTVYEDWKQKELATKGELSEHLAMAVISQRIDDGRAQLDFALINKINDSKLGNELMLEIQPMITIRNADGKPIDSQTVGSATRTFIGGNESVRSLSSPITVSVLIPADQRADAVTVKWVLSNRTADEKRTMSDTTMHMFMLNEPTSSLTAITKAKAAEK